MTKQIVVLEKKNLILLNSSINIWSLIGNTDCGESTFAPKVFFAENVAEIVVTEDKFL